MTFGAAGALLPYGDWELETNESGPDARLFFVGHGGVLYPPGTLSEVVHDEHLRSTLCPTADDVWFNWMARLAGTSVIRTSGHSPRHDTIPGSQATALHVLHRSGGGNDMQIRSMLDHFGVLDPSTGWIAAVGSA